MRRREKSAIGERFLPPPTAESRMEKSKRRQIMINHGASWCSMNAQFRPTGECLCNQTHTLWKENTPGERDARRFCLVSPLLGLRIYTRPQITHKKGVMSERASEWVDRLLSLIGALRAFSWEFDPSEKLRLLHPSLCRNMLAEKMALSLDAKKTGSKIPNPVPAAQIQF